MNSNFEEYGTISECTYEENLEVLINETKKVSQADTAIHSIYEAVKMSDDFKKSCFIKDNEGIGEKVFPILESTDEVLNHIEDNFANRPKIIKTIDAMSPIIWERMSGEFSYPDDAFFIIDNDIGNLLESKSIMKDTIIFLSRWKKNLNLMSDDWWPKIREALENIEADLDDGMVFEEEVNQIKKFAVQMEAIFSAAIDET